MISKKIVLGVSEALAKINPESLKILERYKVDMSMRNLSPATQAAYIGDLKQWFTFVLLYQENKSVCQLTDEDITEFLYFCKNEGNNTERIKRRMSSIAAFFKFMRKKRLIIENPTEFIDRPKKGLQIIQQTFLTPEQISLMREKLIENNNTQLRLYAMLSLSTMARVSAIASLRWDQIDIQNCMIKNVLEKENKIVDLYFSEEVKYLLFKLKEERDLSGRNDHGWIFYSERCTDDKHICKSTLETWCKQIGSLIGVASLHPHDFRHSGATLLKNAGMSLEDISVLLNHDSTDVTKKYYIKQDTARISNTKRMYNI